MKQRGFTLLEIMIAVAILSIALVAILRSHSQSIVLADASIRYEKALFLAREKITEIEMKGFPEVVEEEGVFDNDKDFSWKSKTLETPYEGLREVRLTVTFKIGDTEKKINLETYLAQR